MYKIMIVDDSVILRKNLRKIFENMGHKVVCEAGSGFQAIEQYKTHEIDITTMDITMPAEEGVLNGIEALVKIKEINMNAKVIMITSHGEEALVMESISKGALGYILKPIKADKVKEILEKL